VPAGKSLTALKFAFRSLDYAHDADSNITAFAAAIGGTPAIAGAYADLKVDPARLKAFLDAVHARGSVPYLTFDPKDFSSTDIAAQHGFIGQIPAGVFDAKLREVAGVLRNFGHPVLFRFAHEMNGNWYPYGGVFSGGSADADGNGSADGPQKFIAAWRHVHALFAAEGADKLVWVFSPNVSSHPDASWNAPFAYYPGSAYVDWVAVDVYEHPEEKQLGLAALLAPFYNEMGLFLEGHAGDSAYALRPFGLGEFGTARADSGAKADWYVDAVATIADDDRIGFHALYNGRNGSKDFSIGGLGERLRQAYDTERFVFGPLIPRSLSKLAVR
jgi:hypothetical protein